MRIIFIVIVFILVACRSETSLRDLEVSTHVEIKLPSEAIYGNIVSFSGFHTAVPDLFIDEKIEVTNGKKTRTLILSSQDILVDELLEINDNQKLIKYKTKSTSLPIEQMSHTIEVTKVSAQQCQVSWISNIRVQNQYRSYINQRMTGIQESYLFSLELLGEELEELLQNTEF